MTLEPGDTAPDFTLPDQNGEPVSLSSFAGRNIVLSFYPRPTRRDLRAVLVSFPGCGLRSATSCGDL